MTPFEAVYGRPPPTVLDYSPSTTKVAAVDSLLTSRTQLLATLKANIQRAQLRMKNQVDQQRTDKQFQIEDWVFLKLKPYRQLTVHRRAGFKLAKRFYGPSKIVERIGDVAYRLQLPDGCNIHNVFHVSLLKQCKGDPRWRNTLLCHRQCTTANPFMSLCLGFRQELVQGKPQPQFLIKWEFQPAANATWECAESFIKTYPSFHLEDKVLFDGGGNVTGIIKQPEQNSDIIQSAAHQATRKSSRAPQRSTRLREFVA
ncbi:unnamed protein product [Rhodiola kirilowii]